MTMNKKSLWIINLKKESHSHIPDNLNKDIKKLNNYNY